MKVKVHQWFGAITCLPALFLSLGESLWDRENPKHKILSVSFNAEEPATQLFLSLERDAPLSLFLHED
ncbi:hypothetical protein AMTRI_Chr03g44000 [Amborella trichopoda]